jgi:hypothetical protein
LELHRFNTTEGLNITSTYFENPKTIELPVIWFLILGFVLIILGLKYPYIAIGSPIVFFITFSMSFIYSQNPWISLIAILCMSFSLALMYKWFGGK